jgi:hypothetical protein
LSEVLFQNKTKRIKGGYRIGRHCAVFFKDFLAYREFHPHIERLIKKHNASRIAKKATKIGVQSHVEAPNDFLGPFLG